MFLLAVLGGAFVWALSCTLLAIALGEFVWWLGTR
jgi:hypothetical protein